MLHRIITTDVTANRSFGFHCITVIEFRIENIVYSARKSGLNTIDLTKLQFYKYFRR